MAVQTTTGTIRCGHCKSSHSTIAQVKLCARNHGVAAETQPEVQPTSNVVWKPKHRSWLDVERETRATRQAPPTPAVASKPEPKRAAPAATLPEVASGRYAVLVPGGYPANEALKFFKVDRPTEGKWAGWTFLNIQAGDELFPIKNFQMKLEVLRLIAADPKAAMLRYGQEIGNCGHCGRDLTSNKKDTDGMTSRERGIGPVCWRKMGW